MPGKLRANFAAPKIKNPIVLEADAVDAVIVDIKSPDWFSHDESRAVQRINTTYPDLSLDTTQIPSFLRQTFIEAYRRQADPRSDLSSKGAWVNLTA